MAEKKNGKPIRGKKRKLTYASDLKLKCRVHVAVGGPQCGEDATAYLPGFGDVCDSHRRPGAICYAKKPAKPAKAKAATMRK